jgi:hypothetical protein
MERRTGRRAAGGLAVVLAACVSGCNPGALAYFFLPENKIDPTIRRIASDDPKKEPRVVILTYMGMETRQDLVQADVQLGYLLGRALAEACKENKERLTVVSPSKVEEFKSTHPTWYQSDLRDVGRYFKADYVIYLELNHLSLFDKGNLQMLYNGHIDLVVSLVDVNHPDEPNGREEYHESFPSEARAIAVDAETQPSQFRQMFLAHVARQLTWYFTPHAPRDKYDME